MYEGFLSLKYTYILDDSYPIELLIEVLNDIEVRSKWEEQILEAELIHRYSDNFYTYRMLFHMPIIENRDFVEKMIIFQMDDTYYMYSSSIPDIYYPKRPKCTRGYNIFSVTRIRKVKDKIIVNSASQRDIQANLTGFIGLGVMGRKTANSLTAFCDALIKRLNALLNSRNS